MLLVPGCQVSSGVIHHQPSRLGRLLPPSRWQLVRHHMPVGSRACTHHVGIDHDLTACMVTAGYPHDIPVLAWTIPRSIPGCCSGLGVPFACDACATLPSESQSSTSAGFALAERLRAGKILVPLECKRVQVIDATEVRIKDAARGCVRDSN